MCVHKEHLGFLIFELGSILDSAELHFLFFMKGEHTDFTGVQQFSSEVRKAFITKDDIEIRPADLDGKISSEVFDHCMVVHQIINPDISFTSS